MSPAEQSEYQWPFTPASRQIPLGLACLSTRERACDHTGSHEFFRFLDHLHLECNAVSL